MMNTKLKNLQLGLDFVSVFMGVTQTPLFTAFSAYNQAVGADKHKAYAKFVKEIYDGGGNLSKLVFQLIGEDENVFVKAKAKKQTVSAYIESSVRRELDTFSAFARLTAKDFAEDMQADENSIPAFATTDEDLYQAYSERLAGIEKYGYGVFSSYPMFRLGEDKKIEPIVSADKIGMDTFIGYENERAQVVANTRAFIEGRPAANTLLCGDAGTGKSSTVKAVANAFFSQGVRLIELRKDQLSLLPYVMGKISGNPLKFIIFIDDLAFNKSDDNFSMLKAALEGSASAKAENAVIYATSNRRHIIKETFSDRDGDDVHRNDTMQELLSLSERFGLVILFSKPNKNLYLEIVFELAKKNGVEMKQEELAIKAEAFALKKGNRSARCAEQFIDSLL